MHALKSPSPSSSSEQQVASSSSRSNGNEVEATPTTSKAVQAGNQSGSTMFRNNISSSSSTKPEYQHHHHLNPVQKIPINFLSGGLALATSFAIMHPLDSLKTQIQTAASSSSRTAGGIAAGINLKHLGRGFFTSFLLAAPQGGLRLSTYEYTKHYLMHNKNNLDLGVTASSAIAACMGDTASSIVKVPREVLTARLQSGMDIEYLKSIGSKSPALDTLQLVLKEQGVRGLFRGFLSTTARDWPFMILLFTTYESFKQNHQVFQPPSLFSYSSSTVNSSTPPSIVSSNSPSQPLSPPPSSAINTSNVQFIDDEDEEMSTLKSTLFGGISGGFAGLLTTPFDVIKTNIMTSRGGKTANGKGIVPGGMRTVGMNILRRDGVRGFFAGGTARSVWWFCVCSIFFPIYEHGKDYFAS